MQMIEFIIFSGGVGEAGWKQNVAQFRRDRVQKSICHHVFDVGQLVWNSAVCW